ncbi:transcriptional corepressor SEUSS-like isoform X1 [Cucurbita moschata]|uniref:Transcriptional corepressor SEUSS-like isoform X1 n=2 Tax=Cucurbita moschata TaxID=3662 RepID=A0A6J1FFV1_CUCMO|nr:transcriptional corepressor SEUSS-like isoform X1 [Cucurbita moschata]XP_022939025.1 transcriptional corepressor SEUSS-like isoform X1 [Cucurbita moschata]
MATSGPPTPMGGGAQSVSPSLLRSNSGLIGIQGGLQPSQAAFSSLVSPRNQFNNMNMVGNMSNVSSLLNQSFGNGAPNSGLPCPGSSHTGAEPDPLSGVGNGTSFNNPSSSFVASNMTNPVSSVQGHNPQFSNLSSSQMSSDQQQSQQLEPQNFQHSQQSMEQFSAHQSNQQPQFHAIRGLNGVGPVKLEPQVTSNDQLGQQQQQHLQTLRNLVPVKLESQRLQSLRGLTPVKMEPQQSDQSLFLQQQQQQQQHQLQQPQSQQFLHMSRQPSQAAAAQINLMHQQRLLQLQQQHQQQHLLKSMPPQRPQLQQHYQQQNLSLRSPVKPGYEPGMCARRLTHYMYHQQHRPEDNNIDFWRKFVNEYFAPHAKKKWCVSMYGSGRQTTGVFPQDVWHCEICNRKPGRGFEATAEVLPRLFKIKYESGTMEELLYLDMPREYHNASGQIVLDYAKAIQESVFEQLRVVRDGQLRIVFSPDLKICSWEFCARRHEELIPRRLLIPQVSHLGAAAQKYQSAIQNASSNLSTPELQNNCNMFVASARQLAKALEVPLVNDLGYTKRYVRCLQISEVVNSMKDLIDYSKEARIGPMDSLAKFPRRTSSSSVLTNHAQVSNEQQQQQSSIAHHSNNNQGSVQASAVQLTGSNGVANVNNMANQPSTSNSASTIAGLLHQNSINSRQQNSMADASNSYGGSSVQIPSPGSSSTIPPTQLNPSTFQPPTPSSSNNLSQPSHAAVRNGNQMSAANSPANVSIQQPALSGDADPSDTQSSVQKILQEMMMNNQMNSPTSLVGVGSVVNDMKNVNGVLPTSNPGLNNGNCIGGNGATNSGSGMGGGGYGSMGSGLGQPAMVNGMRTAMGNNSIMNRRIGMASLALEQSMNGQQPQDMGNQLLSGLGAVNGFSNLQFDWKPSP